MKAIVRQSAAGLALLFLAHSAACVRPTTVTPSDTRVASGDWGGQHILLSVTGTGAHVEFDCASGEISMPLTVDIQGRFSVDGVYLREHPGPIIVGGETDPQPARYSGRVDDTTMTLDVMLTVSNQTVGSFTLTRGGLPRVSKCL